MERADGSSSSGSGGESLSKAANGDEKAGIGVGAAVPEKLKVVRVKRKREQAPIESLWLKVSDPPKKRHEPDIGSLSLSSKTASLTAAGTGASAAAKVLFRRLETVSPAGKTEASLVESLLQRVSERKLGHEKRRGQPESRAKGKGKGKEKEKQEQLLAAAKDRHETLARRARFEQVWKSRRDVVADVFGGCAGSDPLRERFHLYDVVRVDEESPDVLVKREKAKREAELAHDSILRNYLPLLRDCLPEAAADLEHDLTSRSASDEYVYDVYAMDEGFSDHEGSEEEFYPTVQIVETEGFDWGEPVESEYDSEDSNDENNPLNDYPDEDDFGGFGDEKSSNDSDDAGDFDLDGSDDEEYDKVAYDNEEELRWRRRA